MCPYCFSSAANSGARVECRDEGKYRRAFFRACCSAFTCGITGMEKYTYILSNLLFVLGENGCSGWCVRYARIPATLGRRERV